MADRENVITDLRTVLWKAYQKEEITHEEYNMGWRCIDYASTVEAIDKARDKESFDAIVNIVKAALDKGNQHIMIGPDMSLSIWPEGDDELGPFQARLVTKSDFTDCLYCDGMKTIPVWREYRGDNDGTWGLLTEGTFDAVDKKIIRYWTWKPTDGQSAGTPWEE